MAGISSLRLNANTHSSTAPIKLSPFAETKTAGSGRTEQDRAQQKSPFIETNGAAVYAAAASTQNRVDEINCGRG